MQTLDDVAALAKRTQLNLGIGGQKEPPRAVPLRQPQALQLPEPAELLLT